MLTSGEVELFRTARLIVRRLQETDVDAMLAVYGDADAMRWVGDGGVLVREQCLRWLAVTQGNYDTRGYGMAALVLLDSGVVAGFCGIVHPHGQVEAEIKYALARDHWGKGLATEAVVGMLGYAGGRLGLRQVIATTAAENLASHRVLLKAGMSPLEREDRDPGGMDFVWRAGFTTAGDA
jgi:RimJ/RimL family protein N-acetyltransferase